MTWVTWFAFPGMVTNAFLTLKVASMWLERRLRYRVRRHVLRTSGGLEALLLWCCVSVGLQSAAHAGPVNVLRSHRLAQGVVRSASELDTSVAVSTAQMACLADHWQESATPSELRVALVPDVGLLEARMGVERLELGSGAVRVTVPGPPPSRCEWFLEDCCLWTRFGTRDSGGVMEWRDYQHMCSPLMERVGESQERSQYLGCIPFVVLYPHLVEGDSGLPHELSSLSRRQRVRVARWAILQARRDAREER